MCWYQLYHHRLNLIRSIITARFSTVSGRACCDLVTLTLMQTARRVQPVLSAAASTVQHRRTIKGATTCMHTASILAAPTRSRAVVVYHQASHVHRLTICHHSARDAVFFSNTPWRTLGPSTSIANIANLLQTCRRLPRS